MDVRSAHDLAGDGRGRRRGLVDQGAVAVAHIYKDAAEDACGRPSLRLRRTTPSRPLVPAPDEDLRRQRSLAASRLCLRALDLPDPAAPRRLLTRPDLFPSPSSLTCRRCCCSCCSLFLLFFSPCCYCSSLLHPFPPPAPGRTVARPFHLLFFAGPWLTTHSHNLLATVGVGGQARASAPNAQDQGPSDGPIHAMVAWKAAWIEPRTERNREGSSSAAARPSTRPAGPTAGRSQ